MTDLRGFVNFLVSGRAYSLSMSDIRKFPGSYFSAAVKKEWCGGQNGGFVEINRDGDLFQYIVDFHFYGELPVTGKRMSVETLQQIQAEADFFNIPELVKSCESVLVKQIRECTRYKGVAACVYASDEPNDLVNLLGSLYAPFCVSGTLSNFGWRSSWNLFKSSTLGDLNIAELLAEAEQSPFGKGTQTVIDTSVRNSVEISADKLNQATLSSLKEAFDVIGFAPRMELEVRPYKLVIYQEGGFFSEHRDSVRGENHIGTLVYILNSAFTGGELVVRQNDVEKRISQPYQWMAMYGDCPHRIEPHARVAHLRSVPDRLYL